MKAINPILSALALFSATTMASAQFSVYGQDGEVIFSMEGTPTYIDFTYNKQNNGTIGKTVDLGLPSGTLWADHNVGAANAEDLGDYYAWGEIEPYYATVGDTYRPVWKTGYSDGYSNTSYKFLDESKHKDNGYTKYTVNDNMKSGIWYNSEGEFIGDNLAELEVADDVAAQNWRGMWRIPTYEQLAELKDECYWVWTKSYNNKNVNGFIVYKPKNSADKGKKVFSGDIPSSDYNVATDVHIFLPAAGRRIDTSLSDVGVLGIYWSRSLYPFNSCSASTLHFSSVDALWFLYYRFTGYPIRPVSSTVY